MKLFTKEIREKLIANFHNSGNDHEPVVKLFDPYGSGTWLLSELDPDENVAFGLCDLGFGFPELGDVSIDEIEAVKFYGVPRIERDRHWQAEAPLSVYARVAREKGAIVSHLPKYDPSGVLNNGTS